MREIQETRSGEGVVFLDLEKDDYFCRYDPNAEEGQARPSSDGVEASTAAADSCPESIWRLDATPRPPIRAIDLLHFTMALIRSVIRYRGRKVADLILIGQTMRVSGGDRQSAPQVANTFKSLLPLLPVRPQCLFEAFFLLHFLARYGHRKSWVFGAHLFPFRAHCWIADGNVLLNEAPHRIEGYQVILTAEPAAS